MVRKLTEINTISCKSKVQSFRYPLVYKKNQGPNRKLNFNEHVTNLSDKESRKTQSLARITQIQVRERLLMNAYFTSQFGYCPLVWIKFPELLEKNKSLIIQSRNLQALAYELFKM